MSARQWDEHRHGRDDFAVTQNGLGGLHLKGGDFLKRPRRVQIRLRSGKIQFDRKTIPTASLSSYSKIVQIAESLKAWIEKSDFLLTESVAPIPGPESGLTFYPLKERP